MDYLSYEVAGLYRWLQRRATRAERAHALPGNRASQDVSVL